MDCPLISQVRGLVSLDPQGLEVPHIGQPSDGPLDQSRQVARDVRGVLARQLDFARESEVVVG
jgi:hypothetical protein